MSCWSCVHSPLKACWAGLSARCRVANSTLSGSPLVAAGSYSVGAQPLFSRGPSPDSITPVHHRLSQRHSGDMASFFMLHAGLRIGLDAILNAIAIVIVIATNRSLVIHSYWRKNFLNFAYWYPLSESVAPPGTAWDAEGLRGNVANENNLMVLALAQPRKGQSGSPFAQEDTHCGITGAEGDGCANVRHRTQAYFASVTCSLFSS